jgi:hypothetical protein
LKRKQQLSSSSALTWPNTGPFLNLLLLLLKLSCLVFARSEFVTFLAFSNNSKAQNVITTQMSRKNWSKTSLSGQLAAFFHDFVI